MYRCGSAANPVHCPLQQQNDSWAMLIPAVYGVSVSEFEHDWQVYLVAHYGLSTKHIPP